MVCPGHLAQLFGRNHLAGVAIEHIKEAILGRLQQHLAAFAVNVECRHGHLLGAIEVPTVTRVDLVVPDVLAGISVERNDRGGVEIVATAWAARLWVVWRGIGGTYI